MRGVSVFWPFPQTISISQRRKLHYAIAADETTLDGAVEGEKKCVSDEDTRALVAYKSAPSLPPHLRDAQDGKRDSDNDSEADSPAPKRQFHGNQHTPATTPSPAANRIVSMRVDTTISPDNQPAPSGSPMSEASVEGTSTSNASIMWVLARKGLQAWARIVIRDQELGKIITVDKNRRYYAVAFRNELVRRGFGKIEASKIAGEALKKPGLKKKVKNSESDHSPEVQNHYSDHTVRRWVKAWEDAPRGKCALCRIAFINTIYMYASHEAIYYIIIALYDVIYQAALYDRYGLSVFGFGCMHSTRRLNHMYHQYYTTIGS